MKRTFPIKYTPFILWWAVGTHYLWGVALLAEPSVSNIAVLVGVSSLLDLGISAHILGAVLITASTMAAYGLLSERHLGRARVLFLLFPQYALLILAVITGTSVLITGDVGQSQDVNRWVLIAALGPLNWAATCHTLGILERYVVHWRI